MSRYLKVPTYVRRFVRTRLLLVYKKVIELVEILPTNVRPWVETWCTLILLNVANTPRKELESKYRQILQILIDKSCADSLGDYLEFGVSYGSSMVCMNKALIGLELNHIRLFGFDSFEGLPDTAKTDDDGYWFPRMFKTDIDFAKKFMIKKGVDWNRCTLIQGWFSDTLNHELLSKYDLKKVSVVMVDCDMYLSAKEALDFSAPLIQDVAVIIFDDWYSGGLNEKNMGEKRAFKEFLAQNAQFKAESLGRFPPNAKVFLVFNKISFNP